MAGGELMEEKLRDSLMDLMKRTAKVTGKIDLELMKYIADQLNESAKLLDLPNVFVVHHEYATGHVWITTREIP
jgi:hypothetical protein